MRSLGWIWARRITVSGAPRTASSTRANFPSEEKLRREETLLDLKDGTHTANARLARWSRPGAAYKGRFDIETGKRFPGDHEPLLYKGVQGSR